MLTDRPDLMRARIWPRRTYRQVRCALCYRHFMPWSRKIKGANYFPHPWMMCHLMCGLMYEAGIESMRKRGERDAG